MNDKTNLQTWGWIFFMLAATLWYAWPQFFFSLFIMYDALETISPESLALLQPLVDYFYQLREQSLWWIKY